MLLRSLFVGTIALWVCAPRPAAAQEEGHPAAPDTKEQARALANKGVKLFKAGHYKEALGTFREAERLIAAPTIRLMIARTHRKLGELLEARSVYQTIVDEKLAYYAPPAFFEAQTRAKDEVEALLKMIPVCTLKVTGAPASAVRVTLDGKPVDASKPIEHNPGTSTIRATAPGREPITRTVTFRIGASIRLDLDFAQPRPPQRPADLPADPRAQPAQGPNMIVVGIGIAASGVLIGLGTTFVILANGKANCFSCHEAKLAQASLRNAAFWSFIGAGAVGATTVGYSIFTVTRSPSAETARLRVNLAGAGMVVSGDW